MLLSGGLGLFLVSSVPGCQGRAIHEDNPVFSAAPPRRSLSNRAADERELALTGSGRTSAASGSRIQTVSHSRLSSGPLTGTSIVAEVNGRPVFVDDVLGGMRRVLEAQPQLPDDERQRFLTAELKKRLDKHCEDELILEALNQKIPEDKRELLKQSLEPRFEQWLESVRKDRNLPPGASLDELFAKEGMTTEMMRTTFLRIQMVEGYLASLDKTPDTVDRQDLVEWYESHRQKYTSAEQVRFAEIVVRFASHGGRPGAEQVMTQLVSRLKNGEDFGAVAAELSDNLTREQQGEVGWIKRGTLKETDVESMLFEMPPGTVSKVLTRDDRFAVYKVIDHRRSETTPFQDVQLEIEEEILQQRRQAARQQLRDEIRARGQIITIFDGQPPIPASGGPFG